MLPASPTLSRPVFASLFTVSAAGAVGLMGMQSVLPAIAREVGIPDVEMVLIYSLSSLLWAVSSPFWAREADRRGQKPLIILGELSLGVSMLLCGLAVMAGAHRWIGSTTVFVMLLLARGLFGLIGAAAPPATQAFVAHRTSRADRTRAVSLLAGAFGLGAIVGPAVAPLFVLPFVGLAGPLFAFGIAGLVIVVVAARVLPATPPQPARALDADEAPAPRTTNLWFDRRLAPFLVFGFLAVSAQMMMNQVLGFMIIDRMRMPPLQAQGFTALAMMAGALGMLLAQWGFIQMFRLTPRQLMRIGPATAAMGGLLVAFAPTFPLMVVGYAVASIGSGMFRPGFTAGASLSVHPSEQARAAGAMTASTGVTSLFAPVIGVMLYHWLHPAPYVAAALILLGLVAFAYRHPILRGDSA